VSARGDEPGDQAGDDDVGYLLSARAVRARARAMLALAEAGALAHFTVDRGRQDALVTRVLATMNARHPDLAAIPPHSRWRHFGAGAVDRLAPLEARLAALPADEALRARVDLVVVSVLLDAGAGAAWRFREPDTGLALGRSEGLAVASLHMFAAGGFSSAPAREPLRADAAGLVALDEAALARAFQASPDNPLVGLAGRVALLRRLGAVLSEAGGAGARVGLLADRLRAHAADGRIAAPDVLQAVLALLGPIWPGRERLHGVNLGDTWRHPQLGLVPLHKLSQWLSYSLIEPLAAAGLQVTDLDGLTGLGEYRNGGLFIDGGLLVPRTPALLAQPHDVGAPPVVEWRALTVALLDDVAQALRARLGLGAAELPLVKVLEGGTWQAGRELAAERRPDGAPPLQVRSDGTVF
jgi:hypothetical protein